ncbi:zinc finger MYM-type protein 1 [Tanacetum coccineum]
MSITRWGSRVESVKLIRFQISDIREALLQVAESENDSLIQSQAKFMATICNLVIFEVFSSNSYLVRDLIRGLISFFEEFREMRLSKAINDAKEIAVEMDIDLVFISDIREALLQVAESENDSLIQSQAKSLATNELGDFEFLVAIVIWFEILYAEFREMRLSKAINDAKEIAVEMDIDLVFVQKHISDIREALLQVAESENDSLIQSQAKSLATNELGDFEFLVAIVIWFEILYAVNLVNKKLQSNDMLIDIAIKEVIGLISFFEEFREMRLSKAINDAKEIAVLIMDIDLRVRSKA